jgi:hypothetical protein
VLVTESRAAKQRSTWVHWIDQFFVVEFPLREPTSIKHRSLNREPVQPHDLLLDKSHLKCF